MDDPDTEVGELARRSRFEKLYAGHSRAILAFAVRRTTQPDDAADVVAETFLVAWRRLDDVPLGDDALLWLYGVARRVVANVRRGARRRARLGSRLATAVGEQMVVDPAEVVGAAAVVRQALASLSADDRELLQLTAWEGLTATQIGEVLAMPAPTVRTRLHRARKRLRDADLRLTEERERLAPDEHTAGTGHDTGSERVLARETEGHP